MVDSPQVIEEAQSIAAIVRGETHLFHDLIRPHERSVFMMVLSLLQNEADAEDAAQEAFLKAFRNLSKFRAESRFSTWLIRIALNEARSKLRQKKSMKTESLDAGSEEDGHVSPASPVAGLNFRVETESNYQGWGCDGKMVTVYCVPGTIGSRQPCG